MTHPSREYEDRLRRALRAAADSVEPSPDGLGRIRARLTPPRPVVAAWMVTETEPSMLRLRSLLTSLRLRIGRPRGQFRPAPAGGARHKLRTQQSWLRPVAALAAFVVIVGSGAFAISKLMQTSTAAAEQFSFGRRHGASVQAALTAAAAGSAVAATRCLSPVSSRAATRTAPRGVSWPRRYFPRAGTRRRNPPARRRRRRRRPPARARRRRRPPARARQRRRRRPPPRRLRQPPRIRRPPRRPPRRRARAPHPACRHRRPRRPSRVIPRPRRPARISRPASPRHKRAS